MPGASLEIQGLLPLHGSATHAAMIKPTPLVCALGMGARGSYLSYYLSSSDHAQAACHAEKGRFRESRRGSKKSPGGCLVEESRPHSLKVPRASNNDPYCRNAPQIIHSTTRQTFYTFCKLWVVCVGCAAGWRRRRRWADAGASCGKAAATRDGLGKGVLAGRAFRTVLV